MRYRDSVEGLRAQVEAKQGELAELTASLSPFARAVLAKQNEQVRGLQAAVEAACGDQPSHEALAQAEVSLDALLTIHRSFVEAAPALFACSDDVRDPEVSDAPRPWPRELDHLCAFRNLLTRYALTLSPTAEIARWGPTAYLTRLRCGGHPFAALVRVHEQVLSQPNTDQRLVTLRSFVTTLRTSVSASVPPIEIRPEGVLHVLGKALRVVREVEVNDPAFDRAFFVTGPRDVVRAIATPPLRSALLDLAPVLPTLSLGNGIAEISLSDVWHNRITPVLPAAALTALGLLRDHTRLPP